MDRSFQLLLLSAVMIAITALAPAKAEAETREVVVQCTGPERKLFRAEVNCVRPGDWFNLVANCPGGDQKIAYQCDPGVAPEGFGHVALLMDIGLAVGVLGVDNMARATGVFHLALEVRFNEHVGIMGQGNIGLTGEVIKDQLGGLPTSSWAGGILFTWRPADFVRLALGANGYTLKTGSFVRALSGVTGTIRADFWFAKDWSVGVVGEVGAGWDPWDQRHTVWSVGAGFTFHPVLLNGK